MKQFNKHIAFLFFFVFLLFAACSDKEPDPQFEEFERLSLQAEYELANDLGREMLLLDPGRGKVLFMMSDNFLNMDQEDSSLVYLEKAIKVEPGWSDLHNNRGMILQNRNDHEGAIEAFNTALELDSI